MGLAVNGVYVDNTKNVAIQGNVVNGMAIAGYQVYAKPSAVVSSIWSAADASAGGMTLSNAGLTVTPSGGGPWNSIRTNTSQSSGKLYAEFVTSEAVTSYNRMFGVADSQFAAGGNYLGNSLYSCAVDNGYATSGFTSNYTYSVLPAANDVFQMAIDFGAEYIWLGLNNTWVSPGNPAAGTNPMATFVLATVGPLFPAMSFYATGVGVWTLQTTAASQRYAPPSGFTAWDG